MSKQFVIEVDSLSKNYRTSIFGPEVKALKSVSFSISEGEVFGFVGANGAGKSTTIKILTGAARASGGRARIFGLDAGDARSRIGLGYVPESPSLYEYMTPLELLRMGLNLHRIRLASPETHCMGWLERFELGGVANRRIKYFSKGMQQRTALAQAMAIHPRLLILDEPLSGLDPVGRRLVIDILAEYKVSGGTLFLTSHVLHDVERLADRFGLIHAGELRAVRSPVELAGGDDRLIVRTAGAAGVAAMIQDSPGRWYAEVSRHEVWPLVDSVRAAGHDIIEIKPALNLEAAFLSVVNKPQCTDPPPTRT